MRCLLHLLSNGRRYYEYCTPFCSGRVIYIANKVRNAPPPRPVRVRHGYSPACAYFYFPPLLPRRCTAVICYPWHPVWLQLMNLSSGAHITGDNNNKNTRRPRSRSRPMLVDQRALSASDWRTPVPFLLYFVTRLFSSAGLSVLPVCPIFL